MAANPSFAATPNIGAALLGSAETDLQSPAQTSTIVTAGTNGTRIEEIVVQASKSGSLIASTVAGLVYVFTYDGTNYRLYDIVTVNAITASATVAGFRFNKPYTNLVLKSGWSLRCSQSIAGNASILEVTGHGADL
jgi:hypothetical protein